MSAEPTQQRNCGCPEDYHLSDCPILHPPTYEVEPPYSRYDYDNAMRQGLDLDVWADYQEYYKLGIENE